ncbi:hypothetical protein [Flavobacterium sp.]|uniref:hypothetical protein n=1 Tax=Flavobacterium sp. TaxID=239 RepID=UPI0031DF508B
MEFIRKVLFVVVFLLCYVTYAHKDRIERPQNFIFVLNTKEVVRFNFTDSKLEKFCNEIISGKKKVTQVQLFYKTGENILIRSNGKQWDLFKISFKNKSLYVPQNKLKKIPEIHFLTLNLLWSGEDNAFNSSYLYLEFDIGNKYSFGVFPSLQLHFENGKFLKSELWSQINKDSKQLQAF